MTTQRRAVVTSITGAQAKAIARSYTDAGFHVRGLSRSAMQGDFETLQVEPTDIDAMARALDGAEIVAFTWPIDYRDGVRERLAQTLVAAAHRAGVRRIVSNAAAPVLENYDRPVSLSMRGIRHIILSGGVEAICLQPTVYMDNLAEPWAKPSIVNDGVLAYPMHPAARVSWISHAALGAFMVAAADVPLASGRVFDIGGPEALTGSEVAGILSQATGRLVEYRFVPPKEFAKGLNAVFGEPVGDHIGDLYSYVETHHDALARNPAGYQMFNLTPERFEDWAQRQSWS
jgi:uncharacterized protein YbjT (DUF2867 family)